MRAHRFWWLLPVLVLGSVACGGDDEVVDPGPDPTHAVVWMLSGDRSGEAAGDHATLELRSAGPDSRAGLLLLVDGGHSLAITSPSGESNVVKTVYEVEESDDEDWHAFLTLQTGGDPEHFAAVDGFLTVEALSDDQVSGFFSLETEQVDDQRRRVPDGLEVRVQGTFTAEIQRTTSGTRAVLKGGFPWLPIARLGFSR